MKRFEQIERFNENHELISDIVNHHIKNFRLQEAQLPAEFGAIYSTAYEWPKEAHQVPMNTGPHKLRTDLIFYKGVGSNLAPNEKER